MTDFHQNRITRLLGRQSKTPKSSKRLVKPTSPATLRPIASPFEDYSYIGLEIVHGNTKRTKYYPCFRDQLCFNCSPGAMPLKVDNDYDSDSEQIQFETQWIIRGIK